MQKEEIARQEFPDGTEVVEFSYCFTPEEKERLQGELGRYEPEKVSKFIRAVEIICNEYKKQIINAKKSNTHLSSLAKYEQCVQKTLHSIDNAFMQLKFVAVPRPELNLEALFNRNLQFNGLDAQKELTTFKRLLEKVDAAKKALWEVEKELNQHKASVNFNEGRPKADSDSFVKLIAKLFDRYFEKPTNYAEGPFVNIICTVFEAMGLPSQDPSRRIRAALKDPGDFPDELIDFLVR